MTEAEWLTLPDWLLVSAQVMGLLQTHAGLPHSPIPLGTWGTRLRRWDPALVNGFQRGGRSAIYTQNDVAIHRE